MNYNDRNCWMNFSKGPLRECLRSCDQPDTNGTKLSARSIQDGRLLFKKEETSECQPCHDLCKDGCYGSTKKDCYDCKYAKVEQVIRNAGEELERRIIVCQDDYQCPQAYYLDDSNFCQQCSPRCNPKFGCTGPGEFIGKVISYKILIQVFYRTWWMCRMFFNHYPKWLSTGFRGSKFTSLSTFIAG